MAKTPIPIGAISPNGTVVIVDGAIQYTLVSEDYFLATVLSAYCARSAEDAISILPELGARACSRKAMSDAGRHAANAQTGASAGAISPNGWQKPDLSHSSG